jgi:uncharacterized membrane protein
MAKIVKRAAFFGLFIVTLATIWVHERYVLRPHDPLWAHFHPFRWWLLPHVITGVVALGLGPLQFSNTVRRWNPDVHRWLGRIYVVAALVSSLLALYIVMVYETPNNRWVMGAMAGLWFLTTACAWISALRRDFIQHKLWVGRSYGLTFTFVATRFLPDLVWPGMDYYGYTALYWMLIVISLVLPDLVIGLGGFRLFRPRID